MNLTGADKRALRAMGNGLKATVFVGKQGVTGEVLATLDEAHRHAELIKARVLDTCPLDRKAAAAELDARSDSTVVQVLGRTILLYRRHPEEPKIPLPSSPLPDKE